MNMTREEQAIVYFKDMRKRMCEDHLKICPKDSVAYRATLIEKGFYDDAIKALEQACEYAVSKEDVLSEIIRFSTEEGASVECQQLYCDVNNMPPVTPATPAQRWIPVSERLPEDRELVLLSTETDEVFEGRFFDDNTDCQWFAFRNGSFVSNHVVTAWMPLPKGYKAESEDI